MAGRRDSLTPPERTHTEDPGAHDLGSDSDSEDHFSDAQSVPAESSRASPIPKTRVEKVDNEPSYGEVPGTEAYRLREGDAEPDEIAVIQDSNQNDKESDAASTLPKPHVPTTVLEEAPDAEGAKTPDGKKHEADPVPDLVVKADGTLEISGTETTTSEPYSAGTAADDTDEEDENGGDNEDDTQAEDAQNEEADEDFGDDFDEFEEGGDADADDDDFGDFDDGFQESAAAPTPPPQPVQPTQQPPSQPAQQAPPALAFPIPDFEGLATDDILSAIAPYLNGLYPPNDSLPAPPQLSNSIFLSPRSESLWSQLVAPPPLQPPDWIRSRIRRLFLVSLGVPVDLDEILPASKQKKLVLPSLSVPKGDSPRTSSESRSNAGTGGKDGASGTSKNNVARLKQSGANGSNSSVDSQGKPSSSSRKRKGPPPPPELDMVTGQQLCKTTDEALDGMTDEELTAHLKKLELVEIAAKEALEYWTKRTDEKIGDREAFEGVIESLVAHARKTRK
ncbi:hypothetical protein F503_04797 [Ophiostoma piceae UAMH 11346]|uniref:Uncharacterized protein n=1 Tax=Ophiostoma piceae (strain UAMH 11346) TaxID=1262450 RepID=S3BRN8_OPHP1|nr:hypothetical protein F503_04797 [Ophiostoma piceae UAMH 11346]